MTLARNSSSSGLSGVSGNGRKLRAGWRRLVWRSCCRRLGRQRLSKEQTVRHQRMHMGMELVNDLRDDGPQATETRLVLFGINPLELVVVAVDALP